MKKDPQPLDSEINHLKRREIQAPIAACLIREFAREIGWEKALQIATTAIQNDAQQAGQELARHTASQSLLDLSRVVKEIWADANAITIRMLEETPSQLRFDVIRCQYAEYYARAGMSDLGYCLSCCRDEAFVRGFNPRIKLTRTGTIMQGETFCDFRFFIKKEDAS